MYLIGKVWTILSITFYLYFIDIGGIKGEESYLEWLAHFNMKGHKNGYYIVATLILLCYIGYIIYTRKMSKEVNKRKCSRPEILTLILGVSMMLYIREGRYYSMRMIILFASAGICILYYSYDYFKCPSYLIRDKKTTYSQSLLSIICLLGMMGLSVYIPKCQYLPGAITVKKLYNSIGGKANIKQRVPYKTTLTGEGENSEAVLFEVQSNEPLHLRSIIYTEYKEGTWSIDDSSCSYEVDIELKSKYLEAEYKQLGYILNQVAMLNRTNKGLEIYNELLSYESNVIREKIYTIIQNPVNKINYFTVNDFSSIKDMSNASIFYYKSLNNAYFYNKKLIEPSHYKVSYYDRVPKIGSREYLFLKKMDETSFNTLYKIIRNHLVQLKDTPKILHTYTPEIQYEKAKKEALGVPKEVLEYIQPLAIKITQGEEGDWNKAEAICHYLKESYHYQRSSKTMDKDPLYYFLFKSKQGNCQSFATAMVLMCRSIGIPSKYVTGYLVTEKDDRTGNYIVREKDAHAFSEVYIPSYGWMTFDATPSEVYNTEVIVENVDDNVTHKVRKGVLVSSILILIIAIYKGGLYYIGEFLWRVYFKTVLDNKTKIRKLLTRLLRKLSQRNLEKEKFETLSIYKNRMQVNGLEIGNIVDSYEKSFYGKEPISREQVEVCYKEYIKVYEALKKYKKDRGEV